MRHEIRTRLNIYLAKGGVFSLQSDINIYFHMKLVFSIIGGRSLVKPMMALTHSFASLLKGTLMTL